jgi:rhodanese-related sulfurtransferase
MIAFIVAGSLVALVLYSLSGKQLVTAKEAKKLLGSVKVVDVRTPAEYRMGHYPGAINIPVTVISRRTTRSLPKSGILVYCNTGQRARFAAEKLVSLGFENVVYIDGSYKSLM